MGSLGDKFKKLAGDQTRQLLQNFQNAQSSKTRNGYSYGKLNEDGTATLADGTTVQVEVKGRPGQYAPVFNLGNGQGLVDQPEAKFFTVDGDLGYRLYSLNTELYQQYPSSMYDTQSIFPPFPDSPVYYFNIVGCRGIIFRDGRSGEEYEVDPSAYSSISDLPMPSYQSIFVPGFIPPEGPVTPANYSLNWTGQGLYIASDGNALFEFKYSGPQVAFSGEGRDILVYHISNYSRNSSVVSTSYLINSTNNYNTGDIFIEYCILKDFYIEGGLVKSDTITTGRFIPPAPPIDSSNTSSGDVDGVVNGFNIQDSCSFSPFLSRGQNNEPDLTVTVRYSSYQEEITTEIPAGPHAYNTRYITVSGGAYFAVFKSINTGAQEVYRVSGSNLELPFYSFYMYNSEFYGIAFDIDQGTWNTRKLNRTSFQEEGPVYQSTFFPGFTYVVTDDYYFPYEAVAAALVAAGLPEASLAAFRVVKRGDNTYISSYLPANETSVAKFIKCSVVDGDLVAAKTAGYSTFSSADYSYTVDYTLPGAESNTRTFQDSPRSSTISAR